MQVKRPMIEATFSKIYLTKELYPEYTKCLQAKINIHFFPLNFLVNFTKEETRVANNIWEKISANCHHSSLVDHLPDMYKPSTKQNHHNGGKN